MNINKSSIRKFTIIYIIWIFTIAIFILMKLFVLFNSYLFSLANIVFALGVIFGCILLSLVLSILFNIIPTIFYFLYLSTYLKYKKNKLSKIDFKNDIYYRDIIKNYSFAELGYIDDFKLDWNEVIATIMALKIKKKVDFVNSSFIILNSDVTDLYDSETYIFELLKNNELRNIDFNQFESIITKSCTTNNLLEYKTNLKYLKQLIITILILTIISFSTLICGAININSKLFIFLIVVLVLSIPFFIYYLIKFCYNQELVKNNPLARTSKGNEINTRLEGLKEFLKDFSLLDKYEFKTIELWEDYLVYSVLFGNNKKIIDYINKIIKI